MGLLSGKFLRDVATGAGEAYLEKRQQARDNIVEYQERALNKYNNLQSKYDEGYKSRQQKAKSFKLLATNLGSSYLPVLNTFAQQGGDLESLASLEDINQIRQNLDDMKLSPTDTPFLETLKQEDKLQSETLNKNLNDYLGIFDNTANVFTKGIVQEGMAGIREDVGPIQTQDLGSTALPVGEGFRTTLTRDEYISQMSSKILEDPNTAFNFQALYGDITPEVYYGDLYDKLYPSNQKNQKNVDNTINTEEDINKAFSG
jgi:hypothetical protein